MYLVYVLEDIRTGRLAVLDMNTVRDLPAGLRAYYQRLWRTMRGRDTERFERVYEPVLRVLAVVREPVTPPMLSELTRLDPARVLEVIRDWRQFLNATDENSAQSRYRVYHSSFRDFLAIDGVGLTPYHDQIVQFGQSLLGRAPDQ